MYMTRKDWSFFYCRLEKNSTFFQHRKFLNTKSLVWGISPSAFLFKTFIVQKSRARFGCLLPLMQYLFTQLQSNMWYVPSVEMGQFFFALRFFGQRQKILSSHRLIFQRWLGSLVILLIMLGFDVVLTRPNDPSLICGDCVLYWAVNFKSCTF